MEAAATTFEHEDDATRRVMALSVTA